MISEPLGLLVHGFDFVAVFFNGTGGYRVIIRNQEFPAMEGLDRTLPRSIDAQLRRK
jgi:hypothetical protein